MSGSGKCLCGELSFTYDSEPGLFLICHCTDCQRATGSPVASIIAIPDKDFYLEGEPGSYTCETKVTRSFCKSCGSQVFSRAESAPGIVLIKTGSLDEQPKITPNLGCWKKSKPEWLNIEHPENTFDENPILG
jgi:hypothetical protein|tara:strand:+ start:88 stop:486 length:399 start_codon:yes stop_codon:yes gene_type:complete